MENANTTTNTKILAALAAAQKAMSGTVVRDLVNPHHRSPYASLEAVMRAVRGPLLENEIIILHAAELEGGVLRVTTTLVHTPSGEEMGMTVPMPLPRLDPQGVGSALTYGRRYGLMAILGLAPEDDDGNAAAGVGGGYGRERRPASGAPAPRAEAADTEGYKPTAFVMKIADRVSGAAGADDLEKVIDFIRRQRLSEEEKTFLRGKVKERKQALGIDEASAEANA